MTTFPELGDMRPGGRPTWVRTPSFDKLARKRRSSRTVHTPALRS